jgi:hypothetical protein
LAVISTDNIGDNEIPHSTWLFRFFMTASC